MLLGIDHSHGPAGRCVLGALTIVVSLLSRSKVLGVADVQRVIGTAQDVRTAFDDDVVVAIGGSRWRELSFDARSPSLRLAAGLLRTFDCRTFDWCWSGPP